jgi:hypothetical protein
MERFVQEAREEVKVVGLDYEIENLLNGDTDNKVHANAAEETGENHLPFQEESFDLVKAIILCASCGKPMTTTSFLREWKGALKEF